MTEQSESIPTDAFNASSPMPSIWRRSVALALFFTLVGPAIGTLGMLAFIYFFPNFPFLFFSNRFFYDNLFVTFSFGQELGTPFAALCGVILAVRAAFTGRINIFETIGAALAATVIVLGIVVLLDFFSSEDLPTSSFSFFITVFSIFAASSVFAAIICRGLFYLLFWPRENGNAA